MKTLCKYERERERQRERENSKYVQERENSTYVHEYLHCTQFKNMTVILDDGVFPKRRKEGNIGLIEAWGRGN